MELVEHLKSEHMDLPLYLVGHSLGALQALRLYQKHEEQFGAAVLINPILHFRDVMSPLSQVGLRLKAKF